ncbi:serine hydrolase domain-containing protein [Evansella sp. AB-rgal1]|uniref:serine hydrolase domain-containing protein n=1 Tax=Evansella sp. AB-rgal1 TaxID=3242696 RepID=UPI00359D7163
METIQVNQKVNEVCEKIDFTGVIFVKVADDIIIQSSYGYSNRADELRNTISTRFGIASGCKLFTAIAICQLVEKGVLSFQTKLKECLPIDFPHFNEDITVHHLLTHSSGIPDYFDETIMDDFEDLWKSKPMYRILELSDFLPMFQNEKMMFSPGKRFHYNNAGYIILGLIVEQISGSRFTNYIVNNVFKPCGMNDSGYFSLDNLPKNTAYGYIDHADGTWRTNIYSIPITGGADGGAFVTAMDMMKMWEGIEKHKLLSEELTNKLFTPSIHVEKNEFYGYGVWITKRNDKIFKYHVMGYDPGVSFHSSLYPEYQAKLVVPSNKGSGPYDIMEMLEEKLWDK